MPVKRRAPLAQVGALAPPAPAASMILARLPALREFLSATSYDDGSPRSPGTFRLSSRFAAWEVTIQDPDAAARLTARDVSLDKALLLVEQLLGVEDAPWETDRYLAEALSKKSKKK